MLVDNIQLGFCEIVNVSIGIFSFNLYIIYQYICSMYPRKSIIYVAENIFKPGDK